MCFREFLDSTITFQLDGSTEPMLNFSRKSKNQTPVCGCGSRAGKILPARPSGIFFCGLSPKYENQKQNFRYIFEIDRTTQQDSEMNEDLFE